MLTHGLYGQVAYDWEFSTAGPKLTAKNSGDLMQ